MSFVVIENATSNLANCMRLYGEAHFSLGRLFLVDPEEGIHNVERGFEAVLEAFHTLYDVSKGYFPYFDHGDTSVLIALRNAIHHRDHPLFQGMLSNFWLNEDRNQYDDTAYLLARHQVSSGGKLFLEAYFKLNDFRLRLDQNVNSPYLDKFLKGKKSLQRFDFICNELSFDTIWQDSKQKGYPDNQVYIDMMPVFVSGIVRIFKALDKLGVNFKGFDAQSYKMPFTSELEIDLTTINYQPFNLVAHPFMQPVHNI